MARPSTSAAEKLEIQLKKSVNRRHVDNVVLHPTYSRSGLPPNSMFIADVIDQTSCSIPFTESGFLPPQHDFVKYTDIKRVHWTREDLFIKNDLREIFGRLDFELSDGSTLVLKNLGKAVLPLLSFFQWLLRERKGQDESLFLQESAEAMFKEIDKRESN
jgi:hypothetical protein